MPHPTAIAGQSVGKNHAENVFVLTVDDAVQDREPGVVLRFVPQREESAEKITTMQKLDPISEARPGPCGCQHTTPVHWTEAPGLLPDNAAVRQTLPEWRRKQHPIGADIPEHDAIGLSFDPVAGELIWWREVGDLHREPLNGKVAWFVPAGVSQNCEWRDDADCVMLLLKPAFVRQAIGNALETVSVREIVSLEREDHFISLLVSELRRVFRCEVEPDPLYLNSISVLLAVHLLRAYSGRNAWASARVGGLSPKALHAVTQYIDEHLKSKLTLAALARRAHLGPRQFGRLFKASTGLSPQQYILRARVQKAHELLRTTHCRVADAAYEVGFYDQSHLDRHFRRVFGFPPSTLLRRRVEAEAIARPA